MNHCQPVTPERIRPSSPSEMAFDAARQPDIDDAELALLRALEARGCLGLFGLDQRDHLLYANSTGKRMLQAEDPLHLCAGRLTAPGISSKQRLLRFLERQRTTQYGHASDRLALQDGDGRFVTIRAYPADASGEAVSGRPSTLLVEVSMPRLMGVTAKQRAIVAREALGWTAREADLVEQLLSGRSVKDAALAMTITEAHARQRLKSIFSKACVTSQMRLMTLLADIA